MAGYSGTPLAKKLGITEGRSVALVGAPPAFAETALADLPAGVSIKPKAAAADVVIAFFTRRADLERRVVALGKHVFPAGGLWIAWPKRSSGVRTDITEDTIRDIALPLGLVDNKVCAIDDTWSGLRLVWRKERRR